MITVSDFNSVIEVSIALHLGFSLLQDVREFLLLDNDRTYEVYRERIDVAARSGDESAKKMLKSFDQSHRAYRGKVEPLSHSMMRFSVLVAVVSILLLISCGYYPQWQLEGGWMMLLLVCLLCPMPFFVAYLTLTTCDSAEGRNYMTQVKKMIEAQGSLNSELASDRSEDRPEGQVIGRRHSNE